LRQVEQKTRPLCCYGPDRFNEIADKQDRRVSHLERPERRREGIGTSSLTAPATPPNRGRPVKDGDVETSWRGPDKKAE